MTWTKTKNVFSLDPADTAGERNLNFTNMLASTWGVQVPASSKEDAAAHRIMVDRIREGLRQLGPSGFSIAGAFSFSGGFPANSFQSAMSKVTIDGLNLTEVGTALNSDTLSQYTLSAPPGSGTRNDLVYLEVFIVEVPGSTATTPTAVNKPDTAHVFKYGNVLYGGNNAVDDINEVNYEIRRRVQVQCRIRVVAGVDFVTYPNGLSDPGVFAQGPNVAVTALLFAGSASDAGLWVAGNGSLAHQSTLGTLDGYVYAVPIAKVARTVGVTTLISGDVTDLRKSWGLQTFLPKAGGTMVGSLVQAVGAPVASASTINLTNVVGNACHVTGTAGVNVVTLAAGKFCEVVFDGILILAHHATNNNLPGAANIDTAADDRAFYWSDGTTVYCLHYQRADGTSVVSSATTNASLLTSGTLALARLPTGISGTLTAGTPLIKNPFVLASIVTQAHGLAGEPDFYKIILECISGSDQGWAVGDRLACRPDARSASADGIGQVLGRASDVYLITSNTAPQITHKTNGGSGSITPGNWKIIITPYKLN